MALARLSKLMRMLDQETLSCGFRKANILCLSVCVEHHGVGGLAQGLRVLSENGCTQDIGTYSACGTGANTRWLGVMRCQNLGGLWVFLPQKGRTGQVLCTSPTQPLSLSPYC